MDKLMSLAAILLLFVFNMSCSDDDKLDILLAVAPAEVQCTAKGEAAEGSSLTVALTCNTAWIAQPDANNSWCKVIPANGNGDATLTVEADAYDGKMARTAVITFTAGGQTAQLKVTQAAALEVAYEIAVPDFSKSFVYNVMKDGVKIAEICREATPGEANPDAESLKTTPEAIVTLYMMNNDEYPEEGMVLTNGGTFKHNGSKYTKGTTEELTKVYLNSAGKIVTSLEEELDIEPLTIEPDVLTDGQGNTYKITKIGKLYWMAENYRCKEYSDDLGMPIKNITDMDEWAADREGAWCYYENNEANEEKFGLIYNGYAVKNGRGLAPEGWKLPTDSEAKEMFEYLGGIMGGGYNDRYLFAGSFLKTNVDNYWDNPYPEDHPAAPKFLNTSGFSCVGGGYLSSYSGFNFYNYYCYYWSDLDPGELDEGYLYRFTIDASGYKDPVLVGGGEKNDGMYVRFVRK